MKKRRISVVFFLLIIILFNSFSVFAADIESWDYYDVAASTNYDLITWVNVDWITNLANYPAGTDVACWDWNNDGIYSHCFGLGSDLDACSAESSTVASVCSQGNCIPSNDLGEKHWMEVHLSTGSKRVVAQYHVDCGLPTYTSDLTWTNLYYILQRRWYICKSKGGKYWDLGDYNDPEYWAIVADDISCSANYGCDPSKDYWGADFGGSGTSVPNAPCSLSDGESCSSDSDCVNDCNSCGECVSNTCPDNCCESGEWCQGDYCGTCGGGTCNTCSSNQCPSYHWYFEGASKYCFDNDELCCSGDSVFGQYYCKYNEEWAECSSSSHYIGEQHGNYYCTYENGVYKWRECPTGCCTDDTCHPPPIQVPDISVSPTSLSFEIGYG